MTVVPAGTEIMFLKPQELTLPRNAMYVCITALIELID